MAYRLKPSRAVTAEIKRVADKQLALALGDLRTLGDPRSDDAVHEARRHVKKARAVLRLAKGALDGAFKPANDDLRRANRLLAPVADGEAIVDTFVRIARRYPKDIPRPVFVKMRSRLLEHELAIDRQAVTERAVPRASHLIRLARRRFKAARFSSGGFRAIAPGLRRSARRCRRSMKEAIAHPTVENYHVWRRRVKDLWLQVRLVEARCGARLSDDRRRLDALDGCLGEAHNCALLERILSARLARGANPGQDFGSRDQVARSLDGIRRYANTLRKTAYRLGSLQFNESAHRFTSRVHHLWKAAKASRSPAGRRKGASWRRAA